MNDISNIYFILFGCIWGCEPAIILTHFWNMWTHKATNVASIILVKKNSTCILILMRIFNRRKICNENAHGFSFSFSSFSLLWNIKGWVNSKQWKFHMNIKSWNSLSVNINSFLFSRCSDICTFHGMVCCCRHCDFSLLHSRDSQS